jgi:hypothetical protein
MRTVRVPALLVALALVGGPARAGVVINEIFFHAPDDLEELQFIELHNTGDKPMPLAGWKLKGVRYEFPAGAVIPANGYVVVCKNLAQFKRSYGFDAAGAFKDALSHKGQRLELVNAAGETVDAVKYGTRGRWPLAPDGYSSSLERICPAASADGPDNWAPSPLPPGPAKPGGSPGQKNINYAPRLPPVIASVTFTPTHAGPTSEVKVEAEVRSGGGPPAVELRYRVVGPGYQRDEKKLPMTKDKKGRYTASIPAQKAGQIIRFRVRAADAKGGARFYPPENDVRPALSVLVHGKLTPGKVPLGMIINVGDTDAAVRPGAPAGGALTLGEPGPQTWPRGKSAFVYVSPKTRAPELFDFINVTRRKAGCKVRFHKDRPLDGMTTINLIYEYLDRFVVAEALAYEVYRKAGNAAPRADFVRTWIDGKPLGYQLLVEQPNRAFLRHNGFNADGNLYKCQWFGHDLVSTHEKKTHGRAGHDDLIKLVNQLNRTKGQAQWAVIKQNFDVEQVINYFAVNMVLSHWDGFFNNYFTYHDVRGTGKWTMYPWDQDKTWGFHDGIQGYDIFFNMPVTFGMAGDGPPGWPKGLPTPGGFGFGSIWWRPGGAFSKPLLANPHFRKLFLARTKEILEKVYTEEVFSPIIKAMGDRLADEVVFRAKVRNEDPQRAVEHLRRNLAALGEHLTKRRQFLLKQEEIKRAGKFDRAGLK